jgi:hypothetical protein
VDARGFIANIWHVMSPQGAAGTQMMPAAGEASVFADSTTVLVLLAALVALLGLVVRRRSAIDQAGS